MPVKPTPFAKKSFGQNFLIDAHYINKIIDALDLQPGETVVEIGAGRGALTEKLMESGSDVIAIELEREMIAVLKEKFGGRENFKLIEQDALKTDFSKIKTNAKSETANPKFKLVANLPYYISTAILQKLIEQRECFSEMILMFQLEVVERISAAPGAKQRGFLTVLVEAYLLSETLFNVPPSAFRPAPKVYSAVARFVPKENVGIADGKIFRELISAGFAQRRKTILNNLKNAPPNLKNKIQEAEKILASCGIDPQRRAENLTLAEWEKLSNRLSENNFAENSS